MAGVFQSNVFQGNVFQQGSALPPTRELVILADASGSGVGIFPAQVKWTQRLLGTATLDSVTIPWEFTKPDGATESRADQIDDGWYCIWQGHRYILEDPDTDNETGIEFKARSAETELANFYTNYSPGPATYLNMLPSDLYTAVLSGKVGRAVKNPGFGILDASDLPTNWYHPAGWASAVVSNRRVWQADAGSEESYSDDIPCTPGVSYRVKVDILASGATGTRGVKVRWIKADGTTVDSVATALATEDGGFYATETADIVALGTKLRIVLYTSGTAHTTQFDDVRLYEIGEDTGWTATATAMDTRLAAVPYNDGAIQRYGVWADAGTPADRIESTAVGDYVARVFNGSFVAINFAAGGTGARAKIRVNGVVIVASLAVDNATTYTVNGLDPTNDHIVEVEVAAVKVSFLGLTVSTENLISMRWDWKTVYEAIVSIREATGGELSFDTIAKTITHTAAVGQDLKANNVLEFRRGANIVKMGRTQGRGKLINRLTGLGYGEGQYQLAVTVDATGVDATTGLTSIATYGVQRGTYTDKECKSLATMTATLQRLVEQSCWYRNAYTVKVTDATAALCAVGDTGHFVYRDINESLRILEITRSTDSADAVLKVANIEEDLTQKLEATRKELATLQKSFQGVPALQNLPLVGDFDYTYPVECPLFVPYGADILDLRLWYEIGGMRATAKSVAGGGAVSTTTGSGGYTSTSTGNGGSTTPTSNSPSTNTSGASSSSTSDDGSGAMVSAVSIMRSGTTDSTWYEVPLAATGGDNGDVDIQMGNFAAASRNLEYEVRTGASGGGTKVAGTTYGLSSGEMRNINVSVASYLASTLYVRVRQTTVATCELRFIASRSAWVDHSHGMAHTHTLNSHTHTVTIGDHTHTFTVPNHTHSFTLTDHTHALSYGIQESAAPTSIRVYLDDVLITALNDQVYVSNFDLAPWMPKDGNGRVTEGKHVVKIATATAGQTGRVNGLVFAQQFVAGSV